MGISLGTLPSEGVFEFQPPNRAISKAVQAWMDRCQYKRIDPPKLLRISPRSTLYAFVLRYELPIRCIDYPVWWLCTDKLYATRLRLQIPGLRILGGRLCDDFGPYT